MVTLRQSELAKLRSGLTTTHEAVRETVLG